MTERKEKHKQKFKERGVTLIALVITIIVLLILAGVALSALTGDSGILNNAESAKEKTNLANAEEQVPLAVQGALTKGYAQGSGTITRDNLKEELDNVVGTGKYELSEGEAPWTVKVGDYQVEVSANGSISKTEEPDDDSLTVADLVAGDYIEYIDKNGDTIECVVLYDSSSGYGVQIVALEPVATTTIGGSTLEDVIASYNGLVEQLNSVAGSKLNTKYAVSARCVGTKPDDSDYENMTYYTSDSTYFQDLSGLVRGVWFVWEDVNQINNLGVNLGCNDFVTPGRWLRDNPNTETCVELGVYVASLLTSGYEPFMEVFYEVSDGVASMKNDGFNVIPIYTLRDDVKIIGEGTEDVPYEFK